MNEEQMNRMMMVAAGILTMMAGLGAISLLVLCAIDYTFATLVASILLGAATVGFGWGTNHYGQKTTGHRLVFTNAAEREVLTTKQRRELRRARGEVVMNRALFEVENERDNITHRALQAANDDNRPPHETRWTVEDDARRKQEEREERERERRELR